MLDVKRLMGHIRACDTLADDSAVALALLIEGGPDNRRLSAELLGQVVPSSPQAAGEAAAEAARELERYVEETAAPLPSAVWALGKTQEPRLADTFASVLGRALDAANEPLARQALAALTALPAEVVPTDPIRRAATSGSDEVRELANDWLGLAR